MAETTVESNRLLEDKRLNSRNENRLHQFKQADMALDYAKTVLRTIVLLNAGALSLIPTFISSFKLDGINSHYLGVSMVCYTASIVAILFVYVFAYLSNSLGAQASIKAADLNYWVLGINHHSERQMEVSADWKKAEKVNRASYSRYNKWTVITEYVAIVFSTLAIFLFFAGALHSIRALPVSVLIQQQKPEVVAVKEIVPDKKSADKPKPNKPQKVVSDKPHKTIQQK